VFAQPASQPWFVWLPWALMAVALCGWAFGLIGAPSLLGSGAGGRRAGSGLRLLPAGQPVARARTLVVYVFSGSDPEYADNLRFFISEAVKVIAGGGGWRQWRGGAAVLLLLRAACMCY